MKTLPFEYAARNLGRSPARMALTVGGAMLVVLLVLTAGGFVTGMQRALITSGSERNMILLGSGSEESLERSEIPMRTPGIVAASIDGLASSAGVEAVSPEVHMAMPVSRSKETEGSLAVLRGMTPAAWLVHDDARIIEGRPPVKGGREAGIGRMAARALGFDPPVTALGASIWVDGQDIELVGLIAADGGVIEGEIWYPLNDLQVLAQRDSLSCVVLTRAEAPPSAINAFAARRLDLELAAIPEDEYFATLSRFYRPIELMVILTAALIAIGGILGGLNTNYATVASRVRELGTLQTLGYSRTAICWSLLQESLLASSIGALLACLIGLAILDGQAVRFSMGVFGIEIDALVLAGGIGAGLALGVVGAMIPAMRCLQLPIPEALRTSA
ncbi:MAG: ABC transporter permease [Phycisphaerales bacterium]|nr:ABC transporter permease [Phycisphaerales bacterium]